MAHLSACECNDRIGEPAVAGSQISSGLGIVDSVSLQRSDGNSSGVCEAVGVKTGLGEDDCSVSVNCSGIGEMSAESECSGVMQLACARNFQAGTVCKMLRDTTECFSTRIIVKSAGYRACAVVTNTVVFLSTDDILVCDYFYRSSTARANALRRKGETANVC